MHLLLSRAENGMNLEAFLIKVLAGELPILVPRPANAGKSGFNTIFFFPLGNIRGPSAGCEKEFSTWGG